MSAVLTRRSALASAAAAALGAPVAAVAATPGKCPVVAPSISPEGVALRAELARLTAVHRQACREVDEAADRTVYPDPPDAVFVRPGDRMLFWRDAAPAWAEGAEGREWWAEHGTVEALRGSSFRYLDGRDDEAACARRDEVVAAWDGWQAADGAAEAASGLHAAEGRFAVAAGALAAFRLRLVETRTDDPEIMTVKARALAELCRCEAVLDGAIQMAVDRGHGAYENAMALSLARDFLRLLGAGVAS